MNWNQTGMPMALVSRSGQRREIAEAKTVLNDAQNQLLQSVDVESMAQKLVESGGMEFVEMVRGLTTALTNAKNELEDANRRYERLVADLGRRGVDVDAGARPHGEPAFSQCGPSNGIPSGNADPNADEQAEWEAWDRRFRSLLIDDGPGQRWREDE